MTSPSSGYIHLSKQCGYITVSLGTGYHMMLSLKKNGRVLKCRVPSVDGEDIYGEVKAIWTPCLEPNTVLLFNYNEILVRVYKDVCVHSNCSHIYFSFHPENQVIEKLLSGLYNCSGSVYPSFQHHLHCNMKQECDDGRDETEHCPFSNADCGGMVASCNRCYSFIDGQTFSQFDSRESNCILRAKDYCTSLGGRLGIPTCVQDIYDGVQSYIDRYFFQVHLVYVGLYYGGLSLPNMYRKSIFDEDKVVFHHLIPVTSSSWDKQDLAACLLLQAQFMLIDCGGENETSWSYMTLNYIDPALMCEFNVSQTQSKPVQVPRTLLTLEKREHISLCQGGHLTYTFLTCGAQRETCPTLTDSCSFSVSERAGDTSFLHTYNSYKIVPMFTCDDGDTSLPFTLVCDVLPDCFDGNDEHFCHYPPCTSGFTCSNNQCVPYSQRCDIISHCLDGSDEKYCSLFKDTSFTFYTLTSPVLVNFDGLSAFSSEEMYNNDSCPDTHYRCSGESGDCLPLYTRCNGMHDCIGFEDEEGCQEFVCPGFYRCRRSVVCVHGDHLCDGWPQCPLHDDELLCDMTCPDVCQCLAGTFLCPQPFHAHLFPQLRYLDASGSEMTLSSFSQNVFLMHLILVQCSLTSLPSLRLFNLIVLDLSGNQLQSVNMTVFIGLKNLKALSLAKNPLHVLFSDVSSTTEQRTLISVDLSNTRLLVFDSELFSSFTSLEKLNLSFTTIHTISNGGFNFIPQLAELYMDGSPVYNLPKDLFENCSLINHISAPTYKFCCSDRLPAQSCSPPREISSCKHLFQPLSYRGFLWLTSCLSITGNIACSVTCLLLTRSTTSFSAVCSVFVINLTVADFIMGISLAITGVADEVFRGVYGQYDGVWTRSHICKMAGFLSVMSTEISAFIVLLLTLDQCIKHSFSTSNVRFDRKTAVLACLLAWVVGLCLALSFLFPTSSGWQLYGHTSTCIPLPFTKSGFDGRVYSISVLISLNVTLFAVISTGQALVYWSIQKDTVMHKAIFFDTIFCRQQLIVSVLHVLGWFCVGVCWVSSQTGNYVFEEISISLALVTFAVHSALNPFVYIFSILAEKDRTLREDQLVQWFHSHVDLPESSSSAS